MSDRLTPDDLAAFRARVGATTHRWYREDVPALLAEVERLTAERDAARAEVAALREAPGVSAEQVEALAAYLWPLAMANGDETVRAFRIGTARDAVTIALGITVTDGGA